MIPMMSGTTMLLERVHEPRPRPALKSTRKTMGRVVAWARRFTSSHSGSMSHVSPEVVPRPDAIAVARQIGIHIEVGADAAGFVAA